MKLAIMYPVAMILCILLISCTKEDLFEDLGLQVTTREVPFLEQEILKLINEQRKSIGLNKLSELAVVKERASAHTDYMIIQNKPSHDYFFEREFFLKEEIEAVTVAENVAYGYNSASAVVKAWDSSNSHKEILEGDFTHFGISVKKNKKGNLFFTNIFIKK